jgi:hypothetical protein
VIIMPARSKHSVPSTDSTQTAVSLIELSSSPCRQSTTLRPGMASVSSDALVMYSVTSAGTATLIFFCCRRHEPQNDMAASSSRCGSSSAINCFAVRRCAATVGGPRWMRALALAAELRSDVDLS